LDNKLYSEIPNLPTGHLIADLKELALLIEENELYLNHLRERQSIILGELALRDGIYI
jgi:hypothetical protein